MSTFDISISKTKIIVPRRRPELLTRQRLINAVNGMLDRKLVMISAPAGYGKTSLLVDLAHNNEYPFCWLSLDAVDREPQRFIAYFISAITERFPKFGKRSRSVLNSLTNLQEGMETVLVTLINEIYAEIHEHFVFVLDDFHLVDDVEPILYFVNRFTQLVDENCHIILSSRTLTNLADLTLLVAREQVDGISIPDLSFRPDEIQALLAQNQHIHLSNEEAQKLVDSTEGWITGLQFTNINLPRDKDAGLTFPSKAVGIDVFDYLGEQVLERQPEWLRLFLLRSSLLEEFDAELCESVLGPFYETRQDWQKTIDLIVQKNLFTLPVDANGQWLRYHHLFRDFLQERLRTGFPEEVTIILRRLARYHEDHKSWEKAYQLYKQLGDVDLLIHLIERAGIPMYQSAMLTLDSWLKDVPPSLFQKRAGLLSLRGAVETLKSNTRAAIGYLDKAIKISREENDTTELALALVRRGNAYRHWSKYEAALHDADEAIDLVGAVDDLQWIYADALRVKGIGLFRQGQSIQAIDYFERALDIYIRINDTPVIPILLMETGMVYAAIGEYTKGQTSYQRALDIWRKTGNLTWQADGLNNLGVLYHQQGNYEQAAQTFEEGLLCAKQGGYIRGEVLIQISMGDLYAELEDFEIAEQSYKQACELSNRLGMQFYINYLALAEFNLALLKKDRKQATLADKQCSRLIDAEHSKYEFGLYQFLRGRLFLLKEKPLQAVDALAGARKSFEQDGRQAERIQCQVWLAAARYESGKRAAALQEVKDIFDSMKLSNPLLILAAYQAGDWLKKLRKDAQVKQNLRDLLKKADSLGVQLPRIRRQLHRLASTVEVPFPKIEITAFGPGNVKVNGRTLTPKDWQTQSVRELFFYLLSSPRPMTKEQIAESLWGDVNEPVNLNLRFKNEIYRLRRTLEPKIVLFNENRYQFNSAVDHEYDVEAFEAFVSKAQSTSRLEDKINLYQKAINLVHGHYLEDFDATWVWPEREKLHQAYLAALLALAELYLEDGQTHNTLETCDNALEYDPAFEPVYRLKMLAYQRIGNRKSIVDAYRTCEQVMWNTYKLPPSEETRKLYRELTS